MNKMIEKKCLLVLVAGLMMSFSFASYASADDLITSVKVRYASIDVNDPKGQEQLYRRLKRAARQVCGPTGIKGTGSIARVAENRLCAEHALNEAVRKVGLETISQLHISQR